MRLRGRVLPPIPGRESLTVEQADWKSYHGYLVVRRRAGLLRSSRFDVWRAGQLVASFRDPIKAEVFIDSQRSR